MSNFKKYYRPIEYPTRFPLELRENGHIVLWYENRKYCSTIAYFMETKEGPCLKFVGDRPFDERVNWEHFGELARQGQWFQDRKFLADYGEGDLGG